MQNDGMTLRELLESYGMLLDKSHCLARETAVCLRRAQENKANASHWRGKAELEYPICTVPCGHPAGHQQAVCIREERGKCL